jgi:signal transduction histidine kinase
MANAQIATVRCGPPEWAAHNYPLSIIHLFTTFGFALGRMRRGKLQTCLRLRSAFTTFAIMVLKILLILSIVLQLVATIIALSLMRRTKYNLSWILFSVALVLLSAMRMWEFLLVTKVSLWLGMEVAISLSIAVGMFYMLKIFNWHDKLEHQRRLTERRILNTVLRTEEKERMRFSKELHDGLGPLLSSARMSLSAIKKVDNQELLDNTIYVIDEAIRSLREISNNLSPHILGDFGLGRGVANFVSKLPANKMEVVLETNLRGERFPADIEVIVYRVVCELVNNSLKYSGGTRADIALNLRDGSLVLEYADDGRGFVPAAMMDVGMGLSNIASRIASLKGVCEIESAPGAGMRAFIAINLESK